MIQTLINADEVEWVQSNIDADKAMRFHYNHPTLSAISGWLSMWYIRLVLDTICKVLGHNIEYDGGYANSDSGGEGFRCTRCGQDWWHQYY